MLEERRVRPDGPDLLASWKRQQSCKICGHVLPSIHIYDSTNHILAWEVNDSTRQDSDIDTPDSLTVVSVVRSGIQSTILLSIRHTHLYLSGASRGQK